MLNNSNTFNISYVIAAWTSGRPEERLAAHSKLDWVLTNLDESDFRDDEIAGVHSDVTEDGVPVVDFAGDPLTVGEVRRRLGEIGFAS